MTINKLTLATALTIGLMAGTINSGIASDVDISSLDMARLAACPLSGCQADVTPDTAMCPMCKQPKSDCGCMPIAPPCGCTGAAAPIIPSCGCEPAPAPCAEPAPACGCEPAPCCEPDPCGCTGAAAPCGCEPAPCCEPAPSISATVLPKCDGKYESKQIYAYPSSVFSDSQRVGTTENNIIIGESQGCGCNLCPTPGVPVAVKPQCGCPCDGGVTGAAAPMAMPILGPSLDCLTGCAAPIAPSCGCSTPAPACSSCATPEPCGIDISTCSCMDVISRTIVPYNAPAITGFAAPLASSFDDVPTGYWANCEINKLAENKVIAGYPDRTFKPNLPVSRAELASMTVNGFNLRSQEKCPAHVFKDVPKSHWANQAINVASSNGIMAGYPNDMFKPNEPVSRAEAMVALAKGIPCEMDTCKAEAILSKFCDGNKVPEWAKIPVAKTIEVGALKDAPNPTEIQAYKDASRADIANMLEQVRISMGYSNKDVASADCGCTGGAAFVAQDVVTQVPTLKLKFQDEINAKSANINDRFAAKTCESVCINGVTFPSGSNVYGKVTEVVRPSNNCGGAIKLSFDTIKNDNCKADLPQQVLTAQVDKVKKPNVFARIVQAPFTWAGSLVGITGRTVGGAIIAAGNAVEHVGDSAGLVFGETLQGQLPAAGRSLIDGTKALVKAPIDTARTALSGTAGLFQTTMDDVAYIVDPKGNKVAAVNPRENISVAFGNNTCSASNK